MKLSKITHKNELRIRVEFPYDAQATARLKQIPDTRWSQTLKCWHIPYTKEAFAQLKELFPEVEYSSAVEMRHAMTVQGSKTEQQKKEKAKKILTLKKQNQLIP